MLRWIGGVILVLGWAGGLVAQPDRQLEKEIRSVTPTDAEDRWLSIPWEQNLMRGRAEAQRAGKPMLIWIMDGNVLGCT